MAAGKKQNRSKRKKFAGRNVGPARNRYWGESRLQLHKVRNLVRCCGMSEDAARLYWRDARTKRMR